MIRVDTNLVNLFFAAVDKDNRFMTFERADVTVFEDGVRQEILTFQKSTDRPLSLALLVDISGSEKRRLTEEQIAAKSLLDAVIRRELDHVAIISFAADPFLEQPLTNNIDEAKRAIDRIQPVRGVLGYQGKGDGFARRRQTGNRIVELHERYLGCALDHFPSPLFTSSHGQS